ncbi:MAG: hypothetical protein OXG35_18960 [Acidobacteria bacterium]|nr:hypothetical protein [Acidobacteriota bacterium]
MGYRTGADRLQAIADRLRVPVATFFVGTVGSIEGVSPVLDLLRHPETARLVRAFAAISDPVTRHRVLSAVEAAAAGAGGPGEPPAWRADAGTSDGAQEGQG